VSINCNVSNYITRKQLLAYMNILMKHAPIYNRPVASSYSLVQPNLRTYYKGRGKSEGCAEHNQHTKHAIARGVWGHAPPGKF